MAFKTVAKVSDVPEGELLHVELDDETQICLANVGGTVYAIGGECTHEGGPLGEGDLTGTQVMCPWHGGEFDVTTGEAKELPPEDPEPTYEVRIEGDEIQVALD